MKQHPSRQRVITLIACTVLPLLLTTGKPVVSHNMHEAAPVHRATLVNVQETPTVDQTVTALQKEKLEHDNNWFWNNGSTLLSVLAIILTALFGLWRWRREQHTEREKRDEDRFQKAVEGLGSEKLDAKLGAAVMLRTFLRPNYKQFYNQVFGLAVAQLRPRKEIPDTPEPLDPLSHELAKVLKESFPLARDILKQKSQFDPHLLDASGVQLDNAYLSRTDLEEIRMRQASLRGTHFWQTNLKEAYLKRSDLRKAYLVEAHLEGADLGRTNLAEADLRKAHLKEAHLRYADLTGADLTGADLTGTRPQGAKSLRNTIMRDIIGLTQEQINECLAKGAIFDDVNQSSVPEVSS